MLKVTAAMLYPEASCSTNLTVVPSDQGMQYKAKLGEKAEFTYSK